MQSIQATAPSRIGEPPGPRVHSSSANFSPPETAKRRASSACASERTLTQKRPVARIAGQLVEVSAGLTAISGGSSETDMKEPIASPAGPSSPWPVTTLTPVGRCPMTLRKWTLSKDVASVMGEANQEFPALRRSGRGGSCSFRQRRSQ